MMDRHQRNSQAEYLRWHMDLEISYIWVILWFCTKTFGQVLGRPLVSPKRSYKHRRKEQKAQIRGEEQHTGPEQGNVNNSRTEGSAKDMRSIKEHLKALRRKITDLRSRDNQTTVGTTDPSTTMLSSSSGFQAILGLRRPTRPLTRPLTH